MNRLRTLWVDYARSETYFAIRRIHFGIMTPARVVCTVVLTVLGYRPIDDLGLSEGEGVLDAGGPLA